MSKIETFNIQRSKCRQIKCHTSYDFSIILGNFVARNLTKGKLSAEHFALPSLYKTIFTGEKLATQDICHAKKSSNRFSQRKNLATDPQYTSDFRVQ